MSQLPESLFFEEACRPVPGEIRAESGGEGLVLTDSRNSFVGQAGFASLYQLQAAFISNVGSSHGCLHCNIPCCKVWFELRLSDLANSS